ncbi:hypothetical protein [Cohnella fermenti]|uniref:Uncharacterized protein n=1 Tax=Cohnella fermenti TaxID=2565925 RepID=A0A4V6RXN6_9BACL|nr:hypothetical protein [Cohnella fermenti]THF82102.1 hypothetical protein E6C55_06865 [Cohnella fermenti]
MTKKTDRISFLKFSRMLFHKWYGDNPSSDFRHFYDDQRTYYGLILEAAGVDADSLKKGNAFSISPKQADLIEELLKQFTSAPMKLFRSKEYKNMHKDDLKSIVQSIDSLLLSGLEGDVQVTERSSLYIKTGYYVQTAISDC